ncbi:MAG: metallophosphoesterase family protein [Solirubrobacteraceae bacterium]|nr:metallophosphoesterase family protein [Solirubrobacteraceae bacterium]
MLALLYDIHGNLPALEAVLADADAAGADRWLVGGDVAAFGGWPSETVERLHALENAQWLRGNIERELAEPGALADDEMLGAALAAARDALGEPTVADLFALPERLTLLEGHFCHASPLNDMESFGVEPADDEDRLIDGVKSQRIVFGHTHVQFTRTRADGLELINPGSIGIPLDGDQRAAYALLGDDGALDLRRVAYDHEAAAAAIGERFGGTPWTAVFADRIRRAAP